MSVPDDLQFVLIVIMSTKQVPQKYPIPAFVRIFVINRILRAYVLENVTTNTYEDNVIQSLLYHVFPQNNGQDKDEALAILSNLLVLGIKSYMTDMFNLATHPSIIEKIHTELILTKFSQEYVNVSKYTANADDDDDDDDDDDNKCCHTYQCRLFNTDDL